MTKQKKWIWWTLLVMPWVVIVGFIASGGADTEWGPAAGGPSTQITPMGGGAKINGLTPENEQPGNDLGVIYTQNEDAH